MVAPSAFSKETSSSSDPACSTSSSKPAKKVGPDISQEEAIPIPRFPEDPPPQIDKSRKFSGRSIIMNPVVLSIISHFPNKSIMKKSEKYVINGLTVPPVPPGKGSPDQNQNQNQKQRIKINNNNNNSEPSQTKSSNNNNKRRPSSKLKRYAGLLLAILSSMMFSFTGLIVKILNHHHPLTQATWMFIGTVVVAIPLNLCRYLYNRRLNQQCERNRTEQDRKESFRSFSEPIEPVKVLENCGGGGRERTDSSTQNEAGNGGIVISSEKLQMGLPSLSPSVAAVVEIMSSNNSANKIALRQQAERRRKIKLFLLLLVRACSGCSGMILYFYSLKYLNVGDSLVIVCSSPIFVFIIGYLFLGESCGVIPVLTIILSMIGVGVITRPPMLTGKETFQTDDMIGAGLAFSSMLCIAMTIILMRFLQNVYHGLINLVFGIWGSIQTTVLALAVGVLECPRDLQDGLLMATTGVLFFLGQTFLAVALQFEEAGPVSLVRTSEVVFAFVWQFIFLNVAPDWFSVSGAGLILAGIFLTISRKWIAAMPEDSRSKKMCGFLLR